MVKNEKWNERSGKGWSGSWVEWELDKEPQGRRLHIGGLNSHPCIITIISKARESLRLECHYQCLFNNVVSEEILNGVTVDNENTA